MKKAILVAGGAGFIGANLCRRLLNDGKTVICVDDLSTGRISNITELMENKNFYFSKVDIKYSSLIDMEVVLNDNLEGIEYIINLACPASPPHYQGDKAINTTMTCVEGVYNLCEVAKRWDCPILQASTSEVYGEPLVHPQPESYRGNVNPIGIRACYDEGKRCAESLMFDFHRIHDIEIKVIRIFNTYGPYMDPKDGRVVSNFICQALKGEPITIYGDGSQTRSFQYIDDLVEAICRVMKTPKEFTGPINLGNPGEFTIKELAQKVVNEISTSAEVVYKDLPKDDPTQRKPDISLAKEVLNWEPKISLDEGLKKTIEYFAKEIAE
nr:MAG TPA: hypothetical protein [Caudoviricetes sp.]